MRTLILVILISVSASAQNLQMAVEAGAGLGIIRNNYDLASYLTHENKGLASFQGHVMVGYGSDRFGAMISPGLTVIRGYDALTYTNYSNIKYEYTYSQQYLTVPMAGYFGFGRMRVAAGFQLGVLLASKVDWKRSGSDPQVNGGADLTASGTEDHKQYMESLDYGPHLKLSWSAPSGFGAYFVGYYGLPQTNTDQWPNSDLRNTYFGLGLSYTIIGKQE